MVHGDGELTDGVLLRELRDKVEIGELMHRRARAADRRDVALALTCYHPDATEDHGGFKGPAGEFVAQAPTGDPDHPIKSMWHGLSSTLAEVDGDDATAETYFTCLLVMEVDGRSEDSITAGRYVDRLRRHEGRWLILERTVVFDWTRVDPHGQQYWEARGMDPRTLHFGAPAPADFLYSLITPGSDRI